MAREKNQEKRFGWSLLVSMQMSSKMVLMSLEKNRNLNIQQFTRNSNNASRRLFQVSLRYVVDFDVEIIARNGLSVEQFV